MKGQCNETSSINGFFIAIFDCQRVFCIDILLSSISRMSFVSGCWIELKFPHSKSESRKIQLEGEKSETTKKRPGRLALSRPYSSYFW